MVDRVVVAVVVGDWVWDVVAVLVAVVVTEVVGDVFSHRENGPCTNAPSASLRTETVLPQLSWSRKKPREHVICARVPGGPENSSTMRPSAAAVSSHVDAPDAPDVANARRMFPKKSVRHLTRPLEPQTPISLLMAGTSAKQLSPPR